MGSKHWWSSASLLLVLLGADCGGKSASEQSGPEPVSDTCPSDKPASGDRCNYQGDAPWCIYSIDKCASVTFACDQGVWREVPVLDGAAYDCNSFQPPNAPKDGDSCDCMGMLDCTYADCSDRGLIHATCDNTTWHVNASTCTRQRCGPSGLECEVDQVCVAHVNDLRGPAFSCEENGCGFAAASCECDASYCAKSESCTIDVGVVVCKELIPK